MASLEPSFSLQFSYPLVLDYEPVEEGKKKTPHCYPFLPFADPLARILRDVRHGVIDDPEEQGGIVTSPSASSTDNTLVALPERQHFQVGPSLPD